MRASAPRPGDHAKQTDAEAYGPQRRLTKPTPVGVIMKNFENLTISDYLSMLRRRFWYIVAVTLLVTIGTTAYVLQLRPTFTSETTIFVFGRLVAENYVDSIVRDSNQDRIEFV